MQFKLEPQSFEVALKACEHGAVGVFFTPALEELNKKLSTTKSLLDEPYKNRWAPKIFSKLEPFGSFKKQLAGELGTFNINNAWLKLAEIYCTVPGIWPKRKEVHYFDNAAFPGSFILASWHYANSNGKKLIWKASSLISKTEINRSPLADTYGLYRNYPKNWIMSKRFNGDVTDVKNIQHAVGVTMPVDIYTSDLGFDVSSDYNAQEQLHGFANFGQLVYGLAILAEGGTSITKQFTYFTEYTAALFAIMSALFAKVYIVKPISSKEDNSEIYLVCVRYNKERGDVILPKLYDLLEKKALPCITAELCSAGFVEMMEKSAAKIYNAQISKIIWNIGKFNEVVADERDLKIAFRKCDAIMKTTVRAKVGEWNRKCDGQLRPLRTNLKMNDVFKQGARVRYELKTNE